MPDVSVCSLVSERIVLQPQRPEHADELAAALDDVALHRFTGGHPLSSDEVRAQIERQAAGHSADGQERWLNWTVRMRTTGAVIGTMQTTIRKEGRQAVAELAWVIGVAHQRQGFAKEAAALVVSWLRSQGITRLRAYIHPDHDASQAVARSVGLLPTVVEDDGEVRWERTDGPSTSRTP